MKNHFKITGRAIEILHVEDSPADANLLKQVLKKAGFLNKLNSVSDGEQALKFLKREKNYSWAPRPDVTILDLKLPGKNGLTIVLTGSESELDVNWAARLKVNHYLAKPYDLDGFAELVTLLREIWMKTSGNCLCLLNLNFAVL
jgi:two-component system, chemotaxis family, response regulator Rcp1